MFEMLLPMLLGQNAFGGGGGTELADPLAMNPPGGGGGAGPDLGGAMKAMQAVNPPQAQKPVFSGGVSGTSLPFLQKADDMITPALNAAAARRAQVPQLPTMAQLLAGR